MAIVDSLLKLVTVRGADALIMPAGKVPLLERGDVASKLSMPVPGDDIVQAILGDVAAAKDARKRLDETGSLSTTYDCDGEAFAVRIEKNEDGYDFVFRLDAGARPAAPSRVSPAEAVSRPPQPQAPMPTPPTSTVQRDTVASGSAVNRAPYRQGGLSIAGVLERAAVDNASDIVISANTPPRMRVGGDMRALEVGPTLPGEIEAFVAPALEAADRDELEQSGSCDIALVTEGRRYRVNVFKQLGGLAAAFRPINREAPTLKSLHLPEDFSQLTRFRSGLVLMVGTAGSGKSTTLVALIEHLNRTRAKHVITIEDPIEYTYVAQQALIHQREVGTHVASFATGLRAALRESPDVILVGEMRDPTTIRAALTAAETGHLVLSTLHSGSADMAVHRIVDVFPEHQQEQVRHQLADVLRAVVTQHLVISSRPPLRVPAYERLMVNAAVSTKIRENRCHQIPTELQRGREEGMVTLELSLARLVKAGLVAMRTAHTLADDATLLEQLVRSA